jgi:D-beta-D-heptose 7-phosphate kinase/D-beta-D-heptose 1-phosphate adenosyltransferase
MSVTIDSVIRRFSQLKVAVLGEAMLDRYLFGSMRRICAEAPAPIVDVDSARDFPGGAANTAANAARLGARTSLASVIGCDCEGERLTELLRSEGVDVSALSGNSSRQTHCKERVSARDQILLRFDRGTTTPIDWQDEQRLCDWLADHSQTADVILISDYDYGVVTPRVVRSLADGKRQGRSLVALDARKLARHRKIGPVAVKPNLSEAAALLQLPDAKRAQQIRRISARRERLLDACGARIAAVTLDRDGALVLERDQPPVRTFGFFGSGIDRPQVSGAGDTYFAAFALSLAAGAATSMAAEIAAAASDVAVRKEATATCSATELLRRLNPSLAPARPLAEVAQAAAEHRRAGRRVVLTGGCFDILHPGHVTYLHRARALGDVLIVAVNTDESIQRLKGPARPINPLADRLCVLAALGCVDLLVTFDEPTPHAVVDAIRPDIFVKGGDYTRQSLPEAALVERLGGEVVILPLVEDRSTTNMIERIRQINGVQAPRGWNIATEKNGRGKHALAGRP